MRNILHQDVAHKNIQMCNLRKSFTEQKLPFLYGMHPNIFYYILDWLLVLIGFYCGCIPLSWYHNNLSMSKPPDGKLEGTQGLNDAVLCCLLSNFILPISWKHHISLTRGSLFPSVHLGKLLFILQHYSRSRFSSLILSIFFKFSRMHRYYFIIHHSHETFSMHPSQLTL